MSAISAAQEQVEMMAARDASSSAPSGQNTSEATASLQALSDADKLKEAHGLSDELPTGLCLSPACGGTEWLRGTRCDYPSALQQDENYLYVGCNMGANFSQWVDEWVETPGMRDRGSIVIKLQKRTWKLVAQAVLPAADAGISAMVLVNGLPDTQSRSDPHANHSAAFLYVAVSPATLLNVQGIMASNGGQWNPVWRMPQAKILRLRADNLLKTDSLRLSVPHVLPLAHDRASLYAGTYSTPGEVVALQTDLITPYALQSAKSVVFARDTGKYPGGVLTNVNNRTLLV